MKIEKLELKHLTGYIDPNGLESNKGLIVGSILPDAVWTEGHPRNIEFIGDVKPILRPLRLLTEEIIHGGEKIVPIVELAKMNDEDFTYSIHVQTKCSESVFGVKYIDCAGLECVFAYRSSSIDFGLHTVSDKRFHQICNTFYLYQKLFEWKFDIYNLIDSGLAIDSTTVGNPYDK